MSVTPGKLNGGANGETGDARARVPLERPPRLRTILASAGSGKTHELTSAYLRLLVHGVPPTRILAATFARRAAGEILDRLLKRLGEGAANDTQARTLGAAIGVNGLTAAECLSTLRVFTRSIHTAFVGTLDSFFHRFASSCALDLDLPLTWSIADEETDRELRRVALLDSLEAADVIEQAQVIRTLHGQYAKREIVSSLERSVAATYDVARDVVDGAWETIPSPGEADWGIAEESLKSIRQEMLEPKRDGTPNKNFVNALHRLRGNIEDRDAEAIIIAGFGRPIVESILSGAETITFYGKPLREDLLSQLWPIVEQAMNDVLTRHVRGGMALRDILKDFGAHYTRLKHARGLVKFDDVPRALSRALSHLKIDDAYYRLDGRIDHVLLDEFQDTSMDQYRLFRPILDEIRGGGEGASESAMGRSVLLVGDPKQSLYRWRGAEPRLLPMLAERGVAEPRDTSFRSDPAVLDAVNEVFLNLHDGLGDGFDDVASAWSSMFREHRKDPKAKRQEAVGFAALHETVGPSAEGDEADASAKKGDQLAACAASAALLVERLMAEQPGWTIGVLVRDHKGLFAVMRALRKRGIPASQEGGNPLTDAPIVRAAMSALTFADSPSDGVAYYHAMHSPARSLLGIEDEFPSRTRVRRAASRLRFRLATEGYDSVLAAWARSIEGELDAWSRRRLSQLVEVAERFGPEAGERPRRFVDRVERHGVESPQPERVRVMTVHASKGLEFDAVVLPTLMESLVGRSPQVLVHAPDPMKPAAWAGRYPSAEVKACHPMLDEAWRAWRARCVHEQLCVLYVAMTRARQRLDMIVPASVERTTKPRSESSAAPTFERVLRGTLLCQGASGGMTDVTHDELRLRTVWAIGTAPPASTSPVEREVEVKTPVRISLVPASRRVVRVSATREVEIGAGVSRHRPQLDDGVARARGLVAHAWFELIEWLEGEGPTDAALRARWEELASEVPSLATLDYSKEAGLFRAAIGADEVRALLVRPELPTRVLREQSFAFTESGEDGSRALRTGRIDRLVLHLDASGKPTRAEVIDFKTEALATDRAGAHSAAETHRPQVEVYREAAARLATLARSRVEARVVFTSQGWVEPLS
ncbi:MAG: UvrD-helicase domain-containing protein [Phycisphaerales bacterium]